MNARAGAGGLWYSDSMIGSGRFFALAARALGALLCLALSAPGRAQPRQPLPDLRAAPPAPAPPPPGLLIITPRQFHETVEEYAAQKRELQNRVEVVDLETILAESTGADDPERVKRYLYERWRRVDSRQRYILLVGDADVFPVRYMVLDRVTAPAFDYAFYPSDLYYADLAKPGGAFEDWNGRHEGFHAGYFGEVRGEKNKDDPINFDGIDYKPEIALGRWPVSTVEEVRIVADKSIAYERAMRAAGRKDTRRAAFVATGGWVENRAAFDSVADRFAKAASPWTIEKRYWADGKEGGRNDHTPPPDEAQVIELLNDGVSLLFHSGHGSDDRWDGSLSVRAIPMLHNEARPAVLLSAGCSTARLATLPPYEPFVDVDGHEHAGTNAGEVFGEPPPPPAPYQRWKYNPTGLGEQMLRAGPAGAVVYFGCNTGSQPCGMTLLEGFADRLANYNPKDPDDPPRVGDCWMHAVAYYYDHQHLATIKPTPDWYPASIFFQGMKFMLYGDPSLPVAWVGDR